MTFDKAIALVEKAVSPDWKYLTFEEAAQVNHATAILAMEYLKVRKRIMPS